MLKMLQQRKEGRKEERKKGPERERARRVASKINRKRWLTGDPLLADSVTERRGNASRKVSSKIRGERQKASTLPAKYNISGTPSANISFSRSEEVF